MAMETVKPSMTLAQGFVEALNQTPLNEGSRVLDHRNPELPINKMKIRNSALTEINGTYAEIAQALTDLDTDPTNFNSTLSAGAENATDITALEAANGTGTINGSALTAINGTAAAVVQNTS